MHTNHLENALLPDFLGGVPAVGWGFGLGSRVRPATNFGVPVPHPGTGLPRFAQW